MKIATPRQLVDRLSDLAKRLPWWAAVLSALVAYTLLHPIAVLTMPEPADMTNVAASAVGQLFQFIARIGQYLLPLAFLAIAAVSGFHRRKHAAPQEPATLSTTGSVSADPAELAVGEHLAALIRADRPVDQDIVLSAPPVDRRRPTLTGKGLKIPRLRKRRVADAVGAFVALSVLWGIYEWFLMLPGTPDNSPWALPRVGSDSAAPGKRVHGIERSRAAAGNLEEERPLGQFLFGPPSRSLISEERPPPVEEAPVEVYHSLGELEAAFDAKYVPPPECYAYESNNLLVRCANHRIRTRRAFIESGGKVTATLLGSWEEPPSVATEALPQDEQLYEEGDWQGDNNGESEPGSAKAPEPQQDWRQEWLRQPDKESEGDWRQEWLGGEPQDPNRSWQPRRSIQDRGEDASADWASQPLPVERRHWVDDL